MIEKIKIVSQGHGEYLPHPKQVILKVNELVDVVNALIDGEFPASMDRIDFRLKLAENLRKAQSEVKE